MRPAVTIAAATARRSASARSRLRHKTGSGAAIIPARSTPNSAMTLSTVFGSCRPMTASACSPSSRRRAAKAEIARSACVNVSLRGARPINTNAVGLIGKRERMRMPHACAAEKVVEGRPMAASVEDHVSAHHVSGR